jgi:predicted Zn-dependent protease
MFDWMFRRHCFVQTLLPDDVQGKDWTFVVVKNTARSFDAYSCPPNYVVFSQGMLSLCETDDELAFVLAHEMGHIASHHAAESLST